MAEQFPTSSAFERKYVRPRVGRTLITGSYVTDGKPDRRARYSDVVGVDMRAGPGVDVVANLEDEDECMFNELGEFDHIECLSVLEHSARPWMLAQNLESMLVEGGTLFVSVPFVWRFHDYPSDYWRFTAEGLRALFPRIEWKTLMYASDKLRPDSYLKAETIGKHSYLPKTEVCGFGVKAAA